LSFHDDATDARFYALRSAIAAAEAKRRRRINNWKRLAALPCLLLAIFLSALANFIRLAIFSDGGYKLASAGVLIGAVLAIFVFVISALIFAWAAYGYAVHPGEM
jgi:hypothetical protein